MFKKYESQEILELVSCQRSHSHPLDVSAIKYTHISPEIKEFIKNCFEKGISFAAVREFVDARPLCERDTVIHERDIRTIEMKIERSRYCYDNDDAKSVKCWAEKLYQCIIVTQTKIRSKWRSVQHWEGL